MKWWSRDVSDASQSWCSLPDLRRRNSSTRLRPSPISTSKTLWMMMLKYCNTITNDRSPRRRGQLKLHLAMDEALSIASISISLHVEDNDKSIGTYYVRISTWLCITRITLKIKEYSNFKMVYLLRDVLAFRFDHCSFYGHDMRYLRQTVIYGCMKVMILTDSNEATARPTGRK